MACLVLVHDAPFAYVVDLAATITGYHVQAADNKKGEEQGPFIIAAQRERFVHSSESSLRSREVGLTSLTINLASLDSVARTQSDAHLKYDHEYLFWPTKFSLKGFSRFLAIVTGQSDPLGQINGKQRSAYIGLTYPNIYVALSNMPIVSVGADALELRIDLLRDKHQQGDIPTLQYVAEQLVALWLQSELPIIFTIRLKPSGGRWPLEKRDLAIKYLRYGLLWGVDFIDVEDLLENDLRDLLVSQKGHTKVIASHHDFSGNLDWLSPDTYQVYKACASYGDVVLMAGISTDLSDASKIRQFRDRINRLDDSKPLSAFNTGQPGKLSRILNPFLQATTHHLLPTSSAPDQLSLVESNGVLSVLGELAPKIVYFERQDPDAALMDKCFKELNLPYRLAFLGQKSDSMIQSLLKEPNTAGGVFGQFSQFSYLSSHSPDVAETGSVDTVVNRDGRTVGYNCQALGLKAILVQEHAPSAFTDQEALVIGHSFEAARTIISVLLSLNCRKVWTLGFTLGSDLGDKVSLLNVKVLSESFNPVGIFCVSPTHDRSILTSLITMTTKRRKKRRIVYLDVQASAQDPVMTAARASEWCIITREHISAAVLVERLRVLVDQSVPYSFVRMVRRQQLS